jgi:hypothetical protein
MIVRVRAALRICICISAFVSALPAAAGAYDTAAAKGAAWLLTQRNVDDGSWGATDDVKYLQTSEAVLALGALNQLSPAYHAGLSWLDNHAPVNIDFTSRRILSLGQAGASVSLDLTALQGAQGTTGVGNNGWGLSGTYIGSPLDTSLSLQALNQQGINANVSQAVSFLTAAQLTGSDSGWALGQESVSDPTTTAQVIQALIPLKSVSTGVPTAIANGLTALNAKVNTSSPVSQIALAALANLRNSSSSSQATTLLNALVSQQATDGSWGEDPYATALALRALAAGLGKDMTAQKQVVNMPDATLRAVVNANLGHGAMDAINVGQLQQLTSLNASNLGIKDLTGLQYATNLQTLDVSNNQINSFAPVASLTNTTINETGNPGYVAVAGNDTADTPTLPEWGVILMGSLMLLTMVRAQRQG